MVKAILEILYGRNSGFMRAIAGADSVLGNPTRLQKFLVKRSNPIWKILEVGLTWGFSQTYIKRAIAMFWYWIKRRSSFPVC